MSSIPPPSTPQPTTPRPKGELNLRRLGRQMLVGLLVLMVALGATGWLLREPLLRLSRSFVDTFGPLGVGLGFFIPDAFAVPVPQDAFMAFGLLGGLGFWQIALWATCGSLLGGSLGYVVGQRLSHLGPVARLLERHGRESRALLERYGAAGVAAGAVTPLPYSFVCWTAGALGMDFRTFLLVSLLRGPRVLFYLWLIEVGVLTIVH